MERINLINGFGFVNDIKTCVENNICGFRIGCFLIGLHIIYKTAFCGQSLKEIYQGMEEKKNKDIDKSMLEEYVKKTTKSAQLHYEIGENSKYVMYSINLYAETILSAAMYTLQLWICSPDYFVIKRCKKCNCHFASKEPREKYCGEYCNKFNVNKKISRIGIKKRK